MLSGRPCLPCSTAPATTVAFTRPSASMALGAADTSLTVIAGSAVGADGSPPAASCAKRLIMTFLMVSSELAIDWVVKADT